ncbi:MAG: methylated-DNA--[protein]-cysteine S-methyltransferase [Deltaproteobacteria bacterium]|nr:methylated-DNA--[protein]-cysteine S-methyltransferase [Deltaproteobacteria bacterium]
MEETFYCLTDTRLGRIGFLWSYDSGKPLIKRIILPAEDRQEELLILKISPHAVKGTDGVIEWLREAIRRYLDGEGVDLSLEYLDFAVCTAFQQKVLLWDRQIPRGMVATYGGLAEKINQPKGARAVGNAQARNPFPIIIPCHRVVRSDGALGGFGGGFKMKRNLLELEGVSFDASEKVRRENIWL